jgi:hypothetical protein
MFRPILAVAFAVTTSIFTFAAEPQQSDGQNKNLDVRSSVGDLHLGSDADARKAGLPLYPAARLRHDEKDSSALNLGLLTEAFGIKLVVAKYESDDTPAKVIDYYRERLKKFGKVLECHTHEHDGDVHSDGDTDEHSKELKCEGDNTGPVTELKVGTENNQHVVAIEPNKGSTGSIFALVYFYDRGKRGDI